MEEREKNLYPHQCPYHESLKEKLDAHDLILNGDRGNPGIVGKLDTLSGTVQDIKKLLQWALGIILTPVLIAIVALVLKSVK